MVENGRLSYTPFSDTFIVVVKLKGDREAAFFAPKPGELIASVQNPILEDDVFSQVEEVAKSLNTWENRMEALNQWLALA